MRAERRALLAEPGSPASGLMLQPWGCRASRYFRSLPASGQVRPGILLGRPGTKVLPRTKSMEKPTEWTPRMFQTATPRVEAAPHCLRPPQPGSPGASRRFRPRRGVSAASPAASRRFRLRFRPRLRLRRGVSGRRGRSGASDFPPRAAREGLRGLRPCTAERRRETPGRGILVSRACTVFSLRGGGPAEAEGQLKCAGVSQRGQSAPLTPRQRGSASC